MSDYTKLEEDLKSQVLELKALVEAGDMSEDEYNELVEDITDSAKISGRIYSGKWGKSLRAKNSKSSSFLRQVCGYGRTENSKSNF